MSKSNRSSPSSSELAYAEVKRRVLDGELPGGELVSEGGIAAELGMSRTPVREAFLRLEAEGLMRLYPQRGALVVPVAEGEERDVLRARHLVEVDAVDQLSASAAAALAPTLEELLAAQTRAAEAGDDAAFAELDADFHRAIVTAGGNAVLAAFYRSLRDRQRRMTTRATRRSPERIRAILDEHRELAGAATGRDPTRYARKLWSHLTLTHPLADPRMPGDHQ